MNMFSTMTSCLFCSHAFSPGIWIGSNVGMPQLDILRWVAQNFEQNMQEINGNGRIQLVCNFYRIKDCLGKNWAIDIVFA